MIKIVFQRYIWFDLDKVEIIDDFGLRIEILIIDLNFLCFLIFMIFEIDKFDLVCKEWGFF